MDRSHMTAFFLCLPRWYGKYSQTGMDELELKWMRPVRTSLGSKPYGSALVCTGPHNKNINE